jgi:hypothetical protein
MLFHSTKISLALLAVAVVLVASPRLAEANSGTVDIRIAKAGFFFGLGRVSGTMHFEGHNYRLNVSGITAGTIGLALAHLRGQAYHLRSAADITGNYTVASVGLAVAGGKKVARLQNINSIVYLQLEGPVVGFELSSALGGITISLL